VFRCSECVLALACLWYSEFRHIVRFDNFQFCRFRAIIDQCGRAMTKAGTNFSEGSAMLQVLAINGDTVTVSAEGLFRVSCNDGIIGELVNRPVADRIAKAYNESHNDDDCATVSSYAEVAQSLSKSCAIAISSAVFLCV
jgi:hypothetical protein